MRGPFNARCAVLIAQRGGRPPFALNCPPLIAGGLRRLLVRNTPSSLRIRTFQRLHPRDANRCRYWIATNDHAVLQLALAQMRDGEIPLVGTAARLDMQHSGPFRGMAAFPPLPGEWRQGRCPPRNHDRPPHLDVRSHGRVGPGRPVCKRGCTNACVRGASCDREHQRGCRTLGACQDEPLEMGRWPPARRWIGPGVTAAFVVMWSGPVVDVPNGGAVPLGAWAFISLLAIGLSLRSGTRDDRAERR
jgi:hypothetical protein